MLRVGYGSSFVKVGSRSGFSFKVGSGSVFISRVESGSGNDEPGSATLRPGASFISGLNIGKKKSLLENSDRHMLVLVIEEKEHILPET